MKRIILNNWVNPDLQSLAGYVSSYTLREEQDLYTIDLLKQTGFYQISEFASPDGKNHFIIEQTNRIGTPRVAAFDKETGSMLGAFKTNTLVGSDEQTVCNVVPLGSLENRALIKDFSATEDDFVAVKPGDTMPAALFMRLPKRCGQAHRLLGKIKSMANHLGKVPHDVFELVILDDTLCDERMLYAIAVILHNRGGLQLI